MSETTARTEELPTTGRALPVVLARLASSRAPKGATIVVEPGAEAVVGSAAGVGLRLVEPTLSGRHCRIAHRSSFVEVIDLGSRNGLRIAGASVSAARVWPGSVVGLGDATLEIVRPTGSQLDLSSVEPLPGVVGTSAPMLSLAYRVRRVAPSHLPVLLRGETGTGKELVASAIHALAGRAGAFVAINAAAISSTLAESELFGHRRGSFTGASADRRGAFAEAHRGTLFLDEIGSLPRDVQAKLLRVVEDGAVRSLGAEQPTRVDVRLVAATCEPLERLVASGRFRQDLYERLASCVVRLPPLRERRADLPILCRALAGKLGLDETSVGRSGLRVLEGLTFRGNVRELKSLLAHAGLLAGPGARIEAEHILEAMSERVGPRPQLADAEILHAYEAAGRNASAASRALGVPRSSVRDAVKRAQTSNMTILSFDQNEP